MKEKVKELLYKSVHRGCKEMDIILGNFAKESLSKLSNDEILEYESIVNMDDSDIYQAIISDDNTNKLIDCIKQFNVSHVDNILHNPDKCS